MGLSVLLHGLSATPLAARYAAWFASHPLDAAPGFESVPTPSSPHADGRGGIRSPITGLPDQDAIARGTAQCG